MKKLISKYEVTVVPAIIGALILALGFYVATNEITPILNLLAPYSLMITGFVAFFIAFGLPGIKDLFSKPSDPKGNIKNFFKYFILTAVLGISASIFLQFVLKLNLTANPASGHLFSLIAKIPFMLLGEELISFYILLVVANLVYKKTGNQKSAELFGIILSSVIFGLLHYSTYFNGNPFTTLIHILLIQGSARIAFNLSGLKSNSIIMPLIIHITYDLVMLGLFQ